MSEPVYTSDGRVCIICGIFRDRVVIRFADESTDTVYKNSLKALKQPIPPNLYYDVACLQYPQDKICGVCGGENTFVDDYGFFYVLHSAISCCKNCWEGPVGQLHRKLFGTGDR